MNRDLGLKNISKPYFTLGFVYCKNPGELRKRLKRYLRRIHLRNKYPRHVSELKFYLPYTELIQQGYTAGQLDVQYSIHMPEIRSRSLNIIRDYTDGIFAAVVDKRTVQSSKWTHERLGNFVFAQTIIVNIMNKLTPLNTPLIYYDKGRLSPTRSINFSNYLINKDSYFEYKGYKLYRGSLSAPIDVASISEPCIWAADIVAGAFYHKYSNKEWAYANILNTKRIGDGERFYWQ